MDENVRVYSMAVALSRCLLKTGIGNASLRCLFALIFFDVKDAPVHSFVRRGLLSLF